MRSPPGAIRRTADVVLVVLFAGAILFPALSSLSGLAPTPALQENRRLAPLPTFSWRRGYPAAFEAYFNDHFAFRDQLVGAYNFAQVRWLGVSPCPQVVIGKEGWLYFRDGLVEDTHAVSPFTEEELARWTHMLEERRQWLEARGSRFLVVVAPDKHTIYPEHLPGWSKPLPRESRLDQLLAYARAHTDLAILDLREPLRQAKERERVYWATDTHWNDQGSIVAYRCVAEALARWFPQVRPLPRSAFSSGTTDIQGDLTRMVGVPEARREEGPCLAPRTPRLAHAAELDMVPPAPPGSPESVKACAVECDNNSLPRAVIFHDSFGVGLDPFLYDHFRRIVTLWQDSFDPAVVEREHPDVVLYEFVERKLTGSIPGNDLPSPGGAGPP